MVFLKIMKRTLFGYTIIMKALVGFCDPIRQEAIEAEIKEYTESIFFRQVLQEFPMPSGCDFSARISGL